MSTYDFQTAAYLLAFCAVVFACIWCVIKEAR